MNHTEKIQLWIKSPFDIKGDDILLLQELKKQFPYFLPFHYLEHFLNASRTERKSLSVLYPANPVLLVLWLSKTANISIPTAPGPVSAVSADSNQSHTTQSFSPRNTRPAFPSSVDSGISGTDYFAGQGIQVENTLPEEMLSNRKTEHISDEGSELSQEKDLMVIMSFGEWLKYLEQRSQKAREEEASQKAFKAKWQQQKLAEALEEETDEIPENVFKMAVSSISREEDLVSETLAEVYIQQGKKGKAIEIYEKLSLQNPEKNAYFAQKIAHLKKEIDI